MPGLKSPFMGPEPSTREKQPAVGAGGVCLEALLQRGHGLVEIELVVGACERSVHRARSVGLVWNPLCAVHEVNGDGAERHQHHQGR